MNPGQKKKDEILYNAEILLWKTEMLIETCDNWLSPEEGNKNIFNAIEKRNKAAKKEKWQNRRTKFYRFFGINYELGIKN
jgi:hypothetical protein